jgi:hypothetical protein
MQCDNTGKKKPYRARGSRGGRRRRKGVQGQNGQSAAFNKGHHPAHSHITANSYAVDANQNFVAIRKLEQNGNQRSNPGYDYRKDVSCNRSNVAPSQFRQATQEYSGQNMRRNYMTISQQPNMRMDYPLLPPAPPLVESSSSFSSHSTSSGNSPEYLYTENNHLGGNHNQSLSIETNHQPNHMDMKGVHIERDAYKYANNTNNFTEVELQERKVHVSTGHVKFTSEKTNPFSAHQEYWPSFFAISPRSFLMGGNPPKVNQND